VAQAYDEARNHPERLLTVAQLKAALRLSTTE
jgi:hypothetical protein